MSHRANYARHYFGEYLGSDDSELSVSWAEFVGDETSVERFEVPAEPVDPYLELQAYEVGTHGHEIYLNGEPISGFDLPPSEGWQYWMDVVTGAALTAGKNTIQIRRDTATDDGFVVGAVIVHWKERVE